MTNILILVGSLREHSLNNRVANIALANFSDGVTASFFDLGTLPLYNGDHDGEHSPEPVRALRAALHAADGVLIVSPEYNYSIPGVVKNAIDWASRPMLPRHSMVGKPMNCIVATMSPANGIRALNDIKRIWAAVGGVPVNTFDFVLQGAQNRFVEVEGVETLDEAGLKGLRAALGHLERLVASAAPAAALENWDAFVAGLSA